jgi:hypothetical protein
MNWYKPIEVKTELGELATWSFSGLKAFEECPLRRYLEKVKGHRQESGPAANRGTAYHDQIEQFIKGEIADLPKMGDIPKAYIEKARETYPNGLITVEQNWYIDMDWNISDKDNFWGVFIIDYFKRESETSAIITDWKTGKSRNNEMKHAEQLLLYAISAAARFPELEYIHVGACYIDENCLKLERGYTKEQLEPMKQQFTKRAMNMTTCTNFIPQPNKFNCKYCALKSTINEDTGQPVCEWGVL